MEGLCSPVRQEEGADIRDGWGSRSELGQSHDVLEGDVCLRANIDNTHILRCATVVVCNGLRGPGGCSPENLDNDGVSPDGLHHSFVMFDLGEVTPVHLGKQRTKSHLTESFMEKLLD